MAASIACRLRPQFRLAAGSQDYTVKKFGGKSPCVCDIPHFFFFFFKVG